VDKTACVAKDKTQMKFRDALPELLMERRLSLRELGRRIGIDATYLSRVRRGRQSLPVELPTKVALALGLPMDFFPETRESLIVDAVRQDPDLRERVYRIVSAPRRRGSSSQT